MSMSSGYDFYLSKCLLPIAPDKLQIKISNANKTITLINEGEINMLKTAALTDIEFECRIPQIPQYPFAKYPSGFKEASCFLDQFEALKAGRKPFQFIISRTLPDGGVLFSNNIRVSLEDYKVTEQASDGFDLKVKIKLKQYRDYGTKTVSIKSVTLNAVQTEVKETRAADSSPAPAASQTYVVVKGDCLYTIARKIYGDGSKYIAIYDANRGVIGGNPNMIYPGQILTIPSAPEAASAVASANAGKKKEEQPRGFSGGGGGGSIVSWKSMQ